VIVAVTFQGSGQLVCKDAQPWGKELKGIHAVVRLIQIRDLFLITVVILDLIACGPKLSPKTTMVVVHITLHTCAPVRELTAAVGPLELSGEWHTIRVMRFMFWQDCSSQGMFQRKFHSPELLD